MDRTLQFNQFMTYQALHFQGIDRGVITAKKAFIFVTVDRLKVLFNLLKEDSTLYSDFVNLKSKKYLTNYSKSWYSSFEKLQDLYFRFKYCKQIETTFFISMNQVKMLYVEDERVNIPSNKNFKQRKALWHRLERSWKTHKKNYGVCEHNFSTLIRNSNKFISEETPENYNHFLWKTAFFRSFYSEFHLLFEDVFSLFIEDHEKDIQEMTALLNVPEEVLRTNLYDILLIMVLKPENKVYLSSLRKEASLLNKRTKSLQKLSLKATLCRETYNREGIFLNDLRND